MKAPLIPTEKFLILLAEMLHGGGSSAARDIERFQSGSESCMLRASRSLTALSTPMKHCLCSGERT